MSSMAIILSLITILFQPALSQTNFLAILQAYATKKGHVPLSRGDSGFYVSADLKNDENDASDVNPGPDTVSMILSLHTSQTLLSNVNDCLNFSSYDCGFYSCTPQTNVSFSHDFLDFTASGYYGYANMYLDYENWKLQSRVALANICDSGRESSYGAAKSGVIGMGIEGNALDNYISRPSFSISISSDLSSGKLLFDEDMSLADLGTAPIYLETDANWTMNTTGNIQIGTNSIETNSTVIFDISKDLIGFPLALYQQIIQNLNQIGPMTCSEDLSLPTCTYKGQIGSLPNIQISCGGKNLSIPPRVYVKNPDGSNSITLNLMALASNLRGDLYVTPIYNNTIVLGSNFMSYYYVVFDAVASPAVTVYVAAAPSKSDTWLYVLLECVGLVLSIGLCITCYCCLKKKKKVTDPANLNANKQSPNVLTLSSRKGSNKSPLLMKNQTSNASNSRGGRYGDQYQPEEEPEIFRKVSRREQ